MDGIWDILNVTNVLVALIVILVVYYLWPVVNPSLAHIPGPWPLPVLGNIYPFLKHGIGAADLIQSKKYGSVFRIYEGRQPTIIVSDPEILKQVAIKDFSNFTNHRVIPFRGVLKESLFDLRNENWHRARVMLTPSFTTGKLKKMFSTVTHCADQCVKNIAKMADKNQDIEVKSYSSLFTMDVIARTGFGVDLDQDDPNNPFLKNAVALIGEFGSDNIYLRISFVFPFLVPLMELLGCEFLPKTNMDFFASLMGKIITDRQQSKNADYHDILQLMLKAHQEHHDHETKADIQEHGLKVHDINKELTSTEVLANSVFLMIAGFDTTSSTLSWLLYELARNPEVQEKVLDEINSVMADYKELEYEAINKMKYLDQTVQETLRMYPQATRTDRYCENDITIKGYKIPAGTLVVIPIYILHNDPDIWPEPEKFKPERFDPEAKKGRHAFAHIPFGQGPRQCIGMRLALMEMKIAAVKLLQAYKFKPGKKKTMVKFDLNAKSVDGTWIKVEKR